MNKYAFIFLFWVLFQNSMIAQSKSKKTYKVSGQVTQSFNYCGGARPSEEMLNNLTKSTPYVAKVFYVKKGKENSLKNAVILKFVIDSAGKFSFNLPAGVYSIIQAEQLQKINYKTLSKISNVTFDKLCLEKWWKQPYHQFELTDKEITGLKFHFNHACFVNSDMPCLQYVGPMPP